MAAALRYSREDLLKSHAYARPHEAAGYRLHGGFMADGAYVSPRTLVRWPAVRAWGEALKARGWPLIDADAELLAAPGYPSFAQHKLLLQEGLGQTFWDDLTITGIIEARGQALCTISAPDLQGLVADDLADTAAGHLNAGLLWAHGADEGGDPATPGVGAHDAMWFAARDLVFGRGAYPIPTPPASISRDVQAREMPDIPPGHEQFIKLLMDVLMIEIKAEVFFAHCCRVMRDPTLFVDRRAEAELAATLIERIREDEQIHVGYLRVLISELRSFTWRTPGGEKRGADILDPVWRRMIDWHGREARDLGAARMRAKLESEIIAARGAAQGRALLARLDALDERVPA